MLMPGNRVDPKVLMPNCCGEKGWPTELKMFCRAKPEGFDDVEVGAAAFECCRAKPSGFPPPESA